MCLSKIKLYKILISIKIANLSFFVVSFVRLRILIMRVVWGNTVIIVKSCFLKVKIYSTDKHIETISLSETGKCYGNTHIVK